MLEYAGMQGGTEVLEYAGAPGETEMPEDAGMLEDAGEGEEVSDG